MIRVLAFLFALLSVATAQTVYNGGGAVVAPAGTLTGTTLASGVTASSLTSFGTSPTITGTASVVSASFSNTISFSSTTNCTGTCISQSTGNALLLGGGTSGFVFNNNAGASNIMTLSNTGVLSVPFLTQTSTAQTGTVCWATGGTMTVDTTAACLTSSARFKHDIQPLQNALSTTLALKPVSYEYNDQKMVVGEQVGFVAEDVALIDDRLVSRESDGSPHAVRYQQLTAVLAGAIQQLKADNDNLRERIHVLEMRNK